MRAPGEQKPTRRALPFELRQIDAAERLTARHTGPRDYTSDTVQIGPRPAQRFGVHRHTLRHTVSHMASQGLVVSRRGAAAFVTGAPADYPIGKRLRFHQNITEAGRLLTKEILSTRPQRTTIRRPRHRRCHHSVLSRGTARGVAGAAARPVFLSRGAAGLWCRGLRPGLEAADCPTRLNDASGAAAHRRKWADPALGRRECRSGGDTGGVAADMVCR